MTMENTMNDLETALKKAKQILPNIRFTIAIDFNEDYIFCGHSIENGGMSEAGVIGVNKYSGDISFPSIVKLSLDYGDEFVEAYNNAVAL